jgi:threonylcarbamoyladenosine tRNA methylthiotransferase MtaB
VIVGFPGETDEEFEETFEFCKQIGFAQMHIFNFSPRPGTRAAEMPNPVDPQIAQVRHQRLADLAKEMSLEFNQRFVGQTVSVLVEGYKEGICSGGSEHYISTSFQGSEKQKRTVVSVGISTASSNGLVGEVVK